MPKTLNRRYLQLIDFYMSGKGAEDKEFDLAPAKRIP